MKNYKLISGIIIICIFIFRGYGFLQAQTFTNAEAHIDIEKMRPVIESRTALYSKYLLDADSVSIAAMYAKDGSMGCSKGMEIISSAGKWVRSSIKNDSRHISFKTDTLNANDELLIETGTADGKNDKGELKYTFRYLVVWKQEDGIWKLYRDISL